jgi:Arc/MetJ-type ribon-helix-helix transcriptional regulator
MGNTEKNPPESNISCRMSENDIKQVDQLVETGNFINRSDVIRSAIREFLRTQ